MENKERRVGTVSRGIRCPIFREGDNLAKLVTDSVLEAAEYENFEMRLTKGGFCDNMVVSKNVSAQLKWNITY